MQQELIAVSRNKIAERLEEAWGLRGEEKEERELRRIDREPPFPNASL